MADKFILGWSMSGNTVQATFERKGVVHLENNSGLKGAIEAEGATAVAGKILDNFYFLFDTPLKIKQRSIAIEILGHVYPGDIAEFFSWVPGANVIIDKTSVIDIGIGKYDGNRWVWDFLAGSDIPLSYRYL